jgi:hypothetical protein
MLGLGDFYYELGVQVVEVCLATREENGGLIGLHELHQAVVVRALHVWSLQGCTHGERANEKSHSCGSAYDDTATSTGPPGPRQSCLPGYLRSPRSGGSLCLLCGALDARMPS